jgi:AcrR family transcriptional regulator
LTSGHGSHKTESVSALDKISGECLRLQGFLTFFDMPTKHSQPPKRKPRADAQRNRERILEVAKEAFTRSGANASLDDIAKQAGVGPGTLYRHFPTREELLQAVYRSELEKLAAAERKFAQTMTPIEALRAWLLLFVDAIAAKELIAPALNTLVGDHKKMFEASYAQTLEAIRSLVKRAIKSGDIRRDLDPIDLIRALVGVANVATSPEWQQSARRLVDILVTGSRPIRQARDIQDVCRRPG